MFTIWVVFHVIICIALILVVLMQSAKGEGLAGSAFGGGGGGGIGGAVFGGRGAASFLSRATTVLAVVFMLNCGALAFMSSKSTGGSTAASGESVVTREAQKERDRALQQQQQQQLQGGDTLNPIGDIPIQIIPGEAADDASTTATDTSGQ